MAKVKKVKTTKPTGCIICQNPEIGEIVNDKLLNAEMTPEDLVEHLSDKYGIFLTEKDIENHKQHIFTILDEDVDRDVVTKTISEGVKNTKNIDIINQEISKLEFIEQNMISKNDDSSANFQNISKIKQKYIEMRMRIEGEDTQKLIHEIPDWIRIKKDV